MFRRGFTLIELLAVVAIIGIVTALALPGYRQHLLRVNRTEAMTALLSLQSAEESFYLRFGTYTGSITAPAPGGLGLPGASASNKYLLSVALAADGQTYIATATPSPVGGQGADQECLAFSIDARGRRAVSGARDSRYCWR